MNEATMKEETMNGKTMRKGVFFSIASVLLALTLAAPPTASALVIVEGYWRLGEDDSGAANGLTGADPTLGRDGSGLNASLNLNQNGGPTYTSAVAASATGATGSNLAMSFNGSTDSYDLAPPVTTATNNFGIEAWVKPTANNGTPVIAYNGNSATSGFGLFIANNRYYGIYGGVGVIDTGVPASLDVWRHLALVRDNGVNQVYVDGTLVNSNAGGGPNPAAGEFAIGQSPLVNANFFSGSVDEVRVFTFATGQFSEQDLLINQQQAVPEPASLLLLGTGLLGMIPYRRAWSRRGTRQ